MSLELLLPAGNRTIEHPRQSPQCALAANELEQLSREWCTDFPRSTDTPSYISPEWKAYGDYFPQGITYSELQAITNKNMEDFPGLEFGIGECFVNVDSKARRADVYLTTCIRGYEGDIRRPGITVLKWHRHGAAWEMYQHLGIKGVYGVFDDP